MFRNIDDFIGLRKQETTLALKPFNVLTDDSLGMKRCIPISGRSSVWPIIFSIHLQK